MNVKHKASKISKPGSVPTWNYRGEFIRNSAGSSYGRGFFYTTNGKQHWTTSMDSAKFFIDDAKRGEI